jgi:hypothetical protein
MPQYLPIQLPAGFHNHGVELDSEGRFRKGNLIRWESGSIRPIGGWRPLQRKGVGGLTEDVEVPAGVARSIHLWLDNGGEAFAGVGTNENLYGSGVLLTLEDITPAGYTPGVLGENIGYGGKQYGRQPYGTQRIPDGVSSPLSVWTLDNFGELLIAVASQDRNIYVWELDYNTPTAARLLSDTADVDLPLCEYIIVTAERFLMALAADGNPRRIAWSDREDIDTWTVTTANEAGFIELQTTGRIVGAVKVRGRTLILTSTDAHVATYSGPPIVYGFQRIGVNCGAAGPQVIADAQFGAFWMSTDAFYRFDGSTVQEIPCEVQDHVFDDLNRLELRKAFAVTNERAQEVWWFYPSAGSVECDRYVAYDYQEGHWIIGEMARSTGADLGVYGDPIWIDSTPAFTNLSNPSPLYRHETGFSHDGVMPWAESGPINLGNGDQVMHVTKMLQDERVQGQLEVSFDTNFWPDDVLFNHGPYQLANATDVRFTGRQVRMRLTGDADTDFRIGGIRLEVQPGGRR